MENLAYIHLAEAYEQQDIPSRPSWIGKWPKFSNRSISSVMSVVLSAAVFGTAVPAIATTIKFGDSGEQVVQVQMRLQELGYFKSKATGYYGSLTENAVKNFQQNNGLAPDGVIGAKTQEALAQTYPETPQPTTQPTVRLGDESPTVLRVQRQLSSLKLYDWRQMNGKFDDATQQAVMNFQKANGLTPDGVVGLKTHTMLQQKTGL
jgi:peptidoglycan hydrolase-like protein with peptidoglycan-binding domain